MQPELKLKVITYKTLYPDKTQGIIFGSDGNVEKIGVGKRDPDIMEIDEVKKKEGKSLWYYQICVGKGFKSKAKSHNIVDCYDKPGNEDKRPQKSSSQSIFSLGSRNKNQSFKAWLIKLLEEESDNSDPPSEDVNMNSTSIEETSDLSLPKRKEKENPNLDFPLGL